MDHGRLARRRKPSQAGGRRTALHAWCSRVRLYAPLTIFGAILAGWVHVPWTSTASAQTIGADGSVTMAGRKLRCGGIPTVLDAGLPMEGASIEGESVMLNPGLLARHPAVVRVFIYHHECAHHTVGADEMAADCEAVGLGVRERWLDRAGLDHVCRSFVNESASETHPSGRVRCRNIDRCFIQAGGDRTPAPAVQQTAASGNLPPLPMRAPSRLAVALPGAAPPLPVKAPLVLRQGPLPVAADSRPAPEQRHGLRADPGTARNSRLEFGQQFLGPSLEQGAAR